VAGAVRFVQRGHAVDRRDALVVLEGEAAREGLTDRGFVVHVQNAHVIDGSPGDDRAGDGDAFS
jgi:hypothetical protein